MKKRVVSLLLVGAMAMSLAACGGSSSSDYTADDTSTSETAETETETDSEETGGMPADYEETSATVYDNALGAFYEAYEAALDAESVSERYALMAQAEAYLLESGVTIPTSTQGGGATRCPEWRRIRSAPCFGDLIMSVIIRLS